MLLFSMLLIAAPVATEFQTTSNPFTQGASAHRPVKRRSRSSGRSRNAPASKASGGSIYYANCSAARAAGAAPVLRGQPGYSRKLDRDNDGVGCE